MSNVFSCICTIGKDAIVNQVNGMSVLNVSGANHIGYGDRQKTQWIRISLWGKRAEGTLKDYLKKGQQIFVTGEVTLSSYVNANQEVIPVLDLNANQIDLIGGKKDGAAPNGQTKYQSESSQQTQNRATPQQSHQIQNRAQTQPSPSQPSNSNAAFADLEEFDDVPF